MRAALVIMGRELRAFFFSPMAYVIGVIFLLFRGWEGLNLAHLFALTGEDFNRFPLGYTIGLSGQMMAVLAPPLLTMRLLAEEKRSGSLELLMTAPVTDTSVVLGKWMAALAFYLILWLPTLALLLLLQAPWLLDRPLALGPVLTVHLWVALAGGLFLAIGLFCSSFTQNQLIASLSAIVLINLLLWAPLLVTRANWAPREGLAGELFAQVSLLDHIQGSFGQGLLDGAEIWFYLSATAAFLFFTIRSLEARKWA